MQNKIIKKLLM